VSDLHRDPLLGTDMALQRPTTTLGAFFFHDSLPVRSAFNKLQRSRAFRAWTPNHGPMVPEYLFQYQ